MIFYAYKLLKVIWGATTMTLEFSKHFIDENGNFIDNKYVV